MTIKKTNEQVASLSETASHFDNKWWTREDAISQRLNIVKDLLKMLDGERVNLITSARIINRAFLTCDFINKKVKKGSNILEMACGYGFVTHVLTEKGYNVNAFDISKESISSAREEALNLSQKPEIFHIENEKYLSKLEDDSLDVIIGLGYLRYLKKDAQDFVYKNARRILKPDGILIIDHQNDLYEMFALNNESIIFWNNLISSYCDLSSILEKDELLNKLTKSISTPIRERKGHSFSGSFEVASENPLTYKDKAKSYGFVLNDILYPHCDILPPFLHNDINKKKLDLIQREYCLKLSRDWKSMFMCYQFLTFLKKTNSNL